MKSFKTKRIEPIYTDCQTKPIISKRLTYLEYLPKKEFEKYQQEHKVRIVGTVCLHQKKYSEPDTDYLNKTKKGIIGVCELKLLDEYALTHKKFREYPYKKFDMYDNSPKRCIGYANVGGNDFVRLSKRKPLLFLIPLIVFVLLGVLFSSCPRNENNETPDFEFAVQESEITSAKDETTTSINAGYRAYAPHIILTKESPEFYLYNDEYNEGAYYQSYEVYVDDELVYSSKLIEPGSYDAGFKTWFFDNLAPGTYKINCKVTSYDIETITPRPRIQNLQTKVTIKK